MASERYLRRKIRKLDAEIRDIEDFFYNQSANEDLYLHAGMLERKRDDVVRCTVLQMHTALEDLLNSLIVHHVLNAESVTRKKNLRTTRGRALHKLLFGGGSMGFDMKLSLAVAHRIITPKVSERLSILNSLRNRCSHNWLLKMPTRRGRRPAQKKPPLLLYRGENLHEPEVVKKFCGEFGPIYAKLFLKL